MISIKKAAIGSVALASGGFVLGTLAGQTQGSLLSGFLGAAFFATTVYLAFRKETLQTQKGLSKKTAQSQVALLKPEKETTQRVNTALFRLNPIKQSRKTEQGASSRILRASIPSSSKTSLISLSIPSSFPTIAPTDEPFLRSRIQSNQRQPGSLFTRILSFASGTMSTIGRFASNMALVNSLQRAWQPVRVPNAAASTPRQVVQRNSSQTMDFERELPYSQDEIDRQREIAREHDHEAWDWAKKFLDDAPNRNFGSAITDLENAAREKYEAYQAHKEANRMEWENAQRRCEEFWRD